MSNVDIVHGFIKAYIRAVGQHHPDQNAWVVTEVEMQTVGETYLAFRGPELTDTFSRLMHVFPNYMNVWKLLDNELARTPWWRFLRWYTLMHRMHRLTIEYEKWFKEQMEKAKP